MGKNKIKSSALIIKGTVAFVLIMMVMTGCSSHKSVKRLDDTIIYDNHSVTTKAEFPGGSKQCKLFKQAFFSDYRANKERLVGEGLISYTFVIDQEGNVRDVEILQSIGPRYDLAVTRLCKKMPKWKPATLNGETVCVRVKDFISVKAKGEDYDIGPSYPGGSEALEAYLTVSGYRDADIGFVSVTFVIDECGNVIDAEVIKGLGRPANNMALDLVKSMKWIPAQKGGKPIRVRETVYVDFIDTEENK